MESGLIEYKGIEAFKTYAQDQVDQAPTKSQKEKLAERFQLKVALTRREHWERAVEEADNAMKKRLVERKSIFAQKLTQSNRRHTMSTEEKCAINNNSESEEGTAKKLKRESTTNEDQSLNKSKSSRNSMPAKLQKRKVFFNFKSEKLSNKKNF